MNQTDDNSKFKFSFNQMISSFDTGKTSATGAIGVFLCLLAMLMIVVIFVFYFFNISEADHILEFLDKAIIILGIGAALLGTRKVTGVINSKNNVMNVVREIEEIVTTQQNEQKSAVNAQEP